MKKKNFSARFWKCCEDEKVCIIAQIVGAIVGVGCGLYLWSLWPPILSEAFDRISKDLQNNYPVALGTFLLAGWPIGALFAISVGLVIFFPFMVAMGAAYITFALLVLVQGFFLTLLKK